MTCDANFNQVGLLCNFDGANGATVIYDNSAFGLPLTNNGSVTLDTSTAQFGSSSAHLSGSNWLQTPIAAKGPLDLSSGDWTVEGWLFATHNGYFLRLNDGGFGPSPGAGGFYIVVSGLGGSVTMVLDGDSASASITAGGTIPGSTWTHFAFVASGGNVTGYLEGVGGSSSAQPAATPWGGDNLYIGDIQSGTQFQGNIDELRITKGFARYTSNFTPPSVAFPTMQCVTADADFPDVSLLMHMDGPSGSMIVTDVSNASMAPVATNIATISNVNTVFGSGVATFNNAGSSYQIDIPYTASGPLDFTGVDFTVECLVNQAVLGGTYFGFFGNINGLAGFFVGSTSAGVLEAGQVISGVNTPLTGAGATVLANTWYALAFVRQGNIYTVYWDGVAVLSLTASGANDRASGDFVIGYTPGISPDSMTGSIDEFRVTKGLARYTSNYTPSSTQFGQDSAVPPADTDFASVSLLLNFDSYNNDDGTGGCFTDTSSNALTITPVPNGGPNPVVTTNNPRFGTSSLVASGNGEYIKSPTITSGSVLDLSTGDWTVEGWVLPAPSTNGNFLRINDPFFGEGIYGTVQAGAHIVFQIFGTSTSVTVSSSSTSPAGTWSHFALVSNGGVLTAYLNGQGSSTAPLPAATPWSGSYLGLGYAGVGALFTGQLDEFRITKGIARYTSNFTPPTLPFGVAPTGTTVPNVVGELLATGEADIVTAGLVVGAVISAPSGSVPTGDIISTNPVAGTSVSLGSSVDIVWSTGLPTVPNVVGESLTAATADIIAAGLAVGTATPVVSVAPPMQVLTQSPVGGTVSAGPVNLTYSEGVPVPDIVNTSVTVIAPGILAAAGFTLGAIGYHVSGTVIAGNIISQSPAAGTDAASGSAVSVVVSSGLPPLTVPDIYGLSQADAELALTTLGLVVGAIGSAPSQFVPPGTVQAQNPSAGTPVAVGSIVSFVLSLGTPATSTAFDFEATVISQYANSPTILQLVSNLNDYIDQSANFANFFNFVWNVDTAVGFGLDVWGKIVGVSRLLHIPSSVDYVGFDNSASPPPDWQPMGSDQDMPPVGGAMYTGYNATQTYLLGDDAYRQLILAKAFANIAATTAPAINQILQNLYGEGTAFVLNDGPMAISYNLTFTPSAIQLAILEQSGVIPTPPGVSVTINTNV